MGKKTKFYQRQTTLNDGDLRSCAYAVVEMSCGCDRHQLERLRDGRYYCKRCGQVFTYVPTTGLFDSIDDLVIQFCKDNISAVQVAEAYLRENETDAPPTPAEEGKPIEIAPEARGSTSEAEDAEASIDELHSRVAELEEAVRQTQSDRDSEVSRLTDENKALKDSISGLRTEITDLETTNRGLGRRLKEAESIRTRDITGALLEYAARIGNLMSDSNATDEEKQFAGVLTERLFGVLDSYGVHVIAHGRGDSLGEESVDILDTPTDDASLDMKVARTLRYGCTFRNGILPAIREDVTVYRYRPDETTTVTEKQE